MLILCRFADSSSRQKHLARDQFLKNREKSRVENRMGKIVQQLESPYYNKITVLETYLQKERLRKI